MKNLLLVYVSILLDVIGLGHSCSSRHYDDAYLNVSTNTVILDAPKGSSGSLRVSSDTYWWVSNKEQWLEVSSKSGNNDAEIRVTATLPNESTDDRFSTITINSGDIRIEVKVVQKGKK